MSATQWEDSRSAPFASRDPTIKAIDDELTRTPGNIRTTKRHLTNMDIEDVDKHPTRRSIFHNPTAKSYKAPQTKDNSAELQAWYSSLPDYAPTKLVPLPDLAAELGIRSVYIKAETSRLGLPSFKLLGASWAVRQAIIHSTRLPSSASLDNLRAAVKETGIRLCAATDGNHGRSVAFMGRLLGVEKIKVFVPRGLDEKIIASIVNEGAEVAAHRFGEETEGFILIEAVAYEGYEDIPRVRCQP
jgi:diaminopropionate ammonia-lyase